jgi:branched-chain amino acid transport system permease protein
VLAAVVSAMAGAAGALYAHYVRVSTGRVPLIYTVTMVIM